MDSTDRLLIGATIVVLYWLLVWIFIRWALNRKTVDQDPYEIAKLGDIHLPAELSLSVRSGVGGEASAPGAIPISKIFPVHAAGDTL
jgi:hypothetical protein